MMHRIRRRSRTVASGVLLVLIPILSSASSADAAPQAPGAPGARHTWAPADKHGFGTARQAGEQRVVHAARSASLSEVYYPDLSTPSLRGLEFAVTDGQHVPRPRDGRRRPAHIEPSRRACAREAARLAHLPPGHRAPRAGV